MKAITAVCPAGASVQAVTANGRIVRHNHHRDGENAEMKMYLSKLKDLVPFMPKNRKLSKLEIIQHVIDYICDLQTELETHPAINNFDANAALSGHGQSHLNNQQQLQLQQHTDERINHASIQQQNISSLPARQPLVVRPSPNTILSTNSNSSVVASIVNSPNNSGSSHSLTTTEKINMDVSRPHC